MVCISTADIRVDPINYYELSSLPWSRDSVIENNLQLNHIAIIMGKQSI